ncbi:pentatricopeptide repeat-containing protein At4g38150-like [Cucurbita moschata]|uniref:Pentatricopeptide repeat-containing protein At4g38150-like n=1 Tax=Cucurbita moschata TaxID=3662 RepID=A0A6J1GKZ0_CUCMO|nr:pentatricopeptide repeat-containing protein At4g38150-like [Cucurbita moschata]XP_022952707.1 pentatricopeptide repeat-containing protein At4g38150-like [Cucurbita moschata]
MGALQMQLQSRLRVSKILSSTIRNWERGFPLLHDPLRTPDLSLSPVESRCFSSNSMDDDWNFSRSEPRSSPPQRRSPPDPREARRVPKFAGEVSAPYPEDNRNQRFNRHSEGSSSRFANDGPMSRPRNESLSQKDFSFLEKFKLNTDNQSTSTEKIEPSSSAQISESMQGKQSQPQCPPEADEIFRKMKETGLIPNAVAMLDGLCKDGLIQEAMKLFGLIREKGTIPEVVVYTAVVDGFCKAEKLDEAIRIFRKMQNNGISPNAFSYGILIQGLYKSKQLEDAVSFCIEMLESGHSPNLTTFVGLIDELCKEKGVDEAHTVIETLKQKGFLINEKDLRDFLNKRAPFSPHIWELIFGKKTKEFF